MGGEDYEYDLDIVIKHIMRYAYILQIATNPLAGRKEFAQKVFQQLNRKVAELYGHRNVTDYATFLKMSDSYLNGI